DPAAFLTANPVRPGVGSPLEGRGGQTPARLAIRRAEGRLTAPSPEQVNTWVTLCGKRRGAILERPSTYFGKLKIMVCVAYATRRGAPSSTSQSSMSADA